MYSIYSGAELVQEPTTTSYSPVNNLSDKTFSGNVALKKVIYRQLSATIVPVYSSNDEVKKVMCRSLSADDVVDRKTSHRSEQMPTSATLRIL